MYRYGYYSKAAIKRCVIVCLPLSILLSLSACETSTEQNYLSLGKVLNKAYNITHTINDSTVSLKNIIHQGKPFKFHDKTLFPFYTAGGEENFMFTMDNFIVSGKKPGLVSSYIMPIDPVIGMQWQTPNNIQLLKRRHESFAGGESFVSVETEILLDMKIESLSEKVKTSVGTYENCLLIKGTSTIPVADRTRGIDSIYIEQWDWYAKDIGLIKRKRREFTTPEMFSVTEVQILKQIF